MSGRLPDRIVYIADRLVDAVVPQLVDRVAAEIAARFGELRPLLDAAGAGRYLGVEESTVRKWAREGRVPVIRLGDGPRARLRFDPQALCDHLSTPPNGDG